MDRIGALLYDRVIGRSQRAGLEELRRETLEIARGAVLEIGAGTGLNLDAYPREGITSLVLTEPDSAMSRQIEARSTLAPAPLRIIAASATQLPFEPESFDTVVGTLVLCEVDDPAAAVEEIARVLRPGGRYLFLEHVRSDNPRLARAQDRWAGAWRTVAGGCNCNRDTLETIAASGLDLETVRHTVFPKGLKLVRPIIIGSALRGDML